MNFVKRFLLEKKTKGKITALKKVKTLLLLILNLLIRL